MSFVTDVERFADYRETARPAIDAVTVAVTPEYARKKLGLKKDEELVYHGLRLNCVGSKRWRLRRFLEAKEAKS